MESLRVYEGDASCLFPRASSSHNSNELRKVVIMKPIIDRCHECKADDVLLKTATYGNGTNIGYCNKFVCRACYFKHQANDRGWANLKPIECMKEVPVTR